MKQRFTRLFTLLCFTFLPGITFTQQFDQDQLGGWYMYFWNTTINESQWGFQGDLQYRNWDIFSDLEQVLLRGGLTYQPENTDVKFTLGYASITTGAFGEPITTFHENRIYQEALLTQKLGSRFFLTHRFRFEQRFVKNQYFRTRWRYNIFVNVPFNQTDLSKGAIYFAFYNELFINGGRIIGSGREVALFDRNRTYLAMGYSLSDHMRIQLGAMRQSTDIWTKWQSQLSLHHKI